jgi:hypothetical protein
MFDQLHFCCEDYATARSPEELQRGLASDLAPQHVVSLDEDRAKIHFDDLGFSVSLLFDDDGHLTGAVAQLPDDMNLGNVSLVSRAFLGLGWTF